MYIRDIIMKKRKKEILNEEEIDFAIKNYFNGQVTDAQMGALMTAIHIYGLNERELRCFIQAISKTGDELEMFRISDKATDIHVLGGVSDKIVLILLAILHSLGAPAIKIIGRELGMEDRLISIPHYHLEQKVEKLKESIHQDNMGVLKALHNLAPVEEKLYRLRHEIACDNDMNLVACSIMSQKLALGFHHLFFEITYGPNAYVKTLSDAKLLAKYLNNVGKKEKRHIGCAVTPLNEPVGKCFGNLIEMREIYQFLSGEPDKEIEEVIMNFGSNILAISGFGRDISRNQRQMKKSIESGEALKSFEKLITMQGGNFAALKEEIKVKHQIPVVADHSGYVTEIDVNELRQLAKYLDAIRMATFSNLDIGAGIIFQKKVGDKVNEGDVLCYIRTNNETKVEDAILMAKEMYRMEGKKPKKLARVEYNLNNV